MMTPDRATGVRPVAPARKLVRTDGPDGPNDAARWNVVRIGVAVVLFGLGQPGGFGVSEDGLEALAINRLRRPGDLRPDGERLATALKLPAVHPYAPHAT